LDRFGHKFFISLFVNALCVYLFDMGIAGALVTFGSTFLTV